MSTEKIEQQTSAPDYMKFGFSNAGELDAFLKTDIGKMVQSETVAHFLEQKENERVMFEYFMAKEEQRRAFVASALMYQEMKDEETRQKNAEASAKPPVAPPPQTPKEDESEKSSKNEELYKGQLDKVNQDIIDTSQKYGQYSEREEEATIVACSIDEEEGLTKEGAVSKLDKMIAELEAEQKDLQEQMMKWDGKDDEEINELVRENNKNEVTLGVYRTLRDVKSGKTEMYDENGVKTDKFANAKYTVPSDKEIVKDPKTNTFYLIDKKEENKELTAEQKLQNMTATEKNDAAAAFKKEEPNMVNVKDFLQNNKRAELKGLFDKKIELQSQLDTSMNLSPNPSQQMTPDQNTPKQTTQTKPENTMVSPFTQGAVAQNVGSIVSPDATTDPVAGAISQATTGPGEPSQSEPDGSTMKSP